MEDLIPCNDCGELLDHNKDELYGEWDDLCECCYNERIQNGQGT